MIRGRTFAVLLLALASSAPAVGQRGAGPGRFKDHEPKDLEQEMAYTLFVPSGVKSGRLYPLVLALHGTGGTTQRHAAQMSRLSSNDAPVFVVAPQFERKQERFAPMYDDILAKSVSIIDAVCAEYPIDRSRMVIEGYSRGAFLSTEWSGSGLGPEVSFPFREVWGCGGGTAPVAEPQPIPHVLVVGEKDTNLWGKYNCRAAARRTYNGLFARGAEAWYVEIPRVAHNIERPAVEVWRPRMGRLRSHADGIPRRRKWPEELRPAIDSFLLTRFDRAFAAVDAVLADEGADRKVASAAKSLVDGFEKHLGRVAKDLARAARSRRSTVHAFTEARGIVARLQEVRPQLAEAFGEAAKKLAGAKHLADEVAALTAFEAARDAGSEQRAKMAALAEGDLAGTVYGRAAAQHVIAIEQQRQAGEATARRRRRDR